MFAPNHKLRSAITALAIGNVGKRRDAATDAHAVGGHAARGDATADGIINVGDVIASLDYLFIGNFDPPCQDALDVDDSGLVDIGDPIAAMNYLFQGGSPPPPPVAPPPAPFPACGADPTADGLGCAIFPPCP